MLLPQAHLPSTMLQPVFSLAEAPHSTSRFTGGPATRAKRIRMSPTVQIEIGRGNALQWQASSSARVQGNWARSGLVSALGVCSKEKLQFPASLFYVPALRQILKKGPRRKTAAVKSTRRRRVMKIFSLGSLERLRAQKWDVRLFSLYSGTGEQKCRCRRRKPLGVCTFFNYAPPKWLSAVESVIKPLVGNALRTPKTLKVYLATAWVPICTRLVNQERCSWNFETYNDARTKANNK